MIIALTALLMMAGTAQAMSYEQARDQALFLTDKMAYELNLTEDQYEAAYEINLDYLMSVNSVDDLYGLYWERRNLDLSYILLDWQYRAYLDARYFYRPLYWSAGYWHFGIYARYPHRTYFYFGRPHFYMTYHGGHSWHHNGGRSWYHGRQFGHGHRHGTNNHGFGMRNGFDRGDYKGRGGHFERPKGGKDLERHGDKPHTRGGVGKDRHDNVGGGSKGHFGGNRQGGFGNRPSSTRQGSDVHHGKTDGKDRGSFSNPNRSFQPGKTTTRPTGEMRRGTERTQPSVSHGTTSRSSGNVGSSRSHFGGSSHSSTAPSRSSSVSRGSSPSHSSAPVRSGGSHGSVSRGGSSGSHSGGSHGGGSHGGGSHGGGHFGGHR